MTLVEWSILVGALMPSLIAVINQPRWPAWAKALATIALCVVAGGVTAALEGQFTGLGLVQSIGVVIAAALATYHTWWKPSGITNKIESATAIGGP